MRVIGRRDIASRMTICDLDCRRPFCVVATAVHLASIADRHPCAAGRRPARARRRPTRRRSASSGRSAASTISSKTRCAPPSSSTIRATRSCSASRRAGDPVVPLVRAADRRASRMSRRACSIGDERISDNPKLNNVFKGWRAAQPRLDRDGRQQRADAARLPAAAAGGLARRHRRSSARRRSAAARTGSGPSSNARSSTPIRRAGNMTADTHRARLRAGQDDALSPQRSSRAPAAFARWRRSRPKTRPPPRSCATAGLRVRLVDAPFEQPLGERCGADVWQRQLRWARLRRASFPACYCAGTRLRRRLAADRGRRRGGRLAMALAHASWRFAAFWFGVRGRARARGRLASALALAAGVAAARPACCRCSGSEAGSPPVSSGADSRWK